MYAKVARVSILLAVVLAIACAEASKQGTAESVLSWEQARLKLE